MTIPKFKKINIVSYKPGKSGIKNDKNYIKLSANESSLGVSLNARRLFNNKSLITNRYPDSKSMVLRKAISKEFRCDFNKIICGAGSDEIIQMICQLYLNQNDEVILPEFSFLMYRIYSKIVGAKVKFSKEKNFKISTSNILKKVNRKRINIFKIFFVFIITFIAIILLLDTFKSQISLIFPDIEIFLNNLYQSILDVNLFFKDLIK